MLTFRSFLMESSSSSFYGLDMKQYEEKGDEFFCDGKPISETKFQKALKATEADDITVAKAFMKYVKSLGYNAYIVGGYARDTIFKTPSHDVDIATDAPLSLFKDIQVSNISKNKTADIIEVKIGKSHKFEVAKLLNDDIFQDLDRRDFTINSLAVDDEGNIVGKQDYIDDFKKKVIRTPNDSELPFIEDPLRIIRGIRFSHKFDFDISEITQSHMREYKESINKLDASRVYNEVVKGIKTSGKKKSYWDFIRKYDLDSILFNGVFKNCDAMESEKPEEFFPSFFALNRLVYKQDKFSKIGIPNEILDLMKYVSFNKEFIEKLPSSDDYSIWKLVGKNDKKKGICFDPKYETVKKVLALINPSIISDAKRILEKAKKISPVSITGYDLQKIGIKPGFGFAEKLDKANALCFNAGMSKQEALERIKN